MRLRQWLNKLILKSYWVITVGILLLSTSCATSASYRRKVQTWYGKNPESLIQSWGNPDATETLSNGTKILIYSRLHHKVYHFVDQNLEAPVPSQEASPASSHPIYIRCSTFFEVTHENKIQSIEFRGDECID